MSEDAPPERDPSFLDFFRERLVRAGRWVYEVLRGYTWGRHLDQRER